jgi:hypothetical protein
MSHKFCTISKILSMGVLLLAMSARVGMAADSDAAAVDAQLVMAITDIPVDTPIKARLLVHNSGTPSIVLPADMLPEGWLISLTIRRSDGLQVYLSAPAKVEMTSASLDNTRVRGRQGMRSGRTSKRKTHVATRSCSRISCESKSRSTRAGRVGQYDEGNVATRHGPVRVGRPRGAPAARMFFSQMAVASNYCRGRSCIDPIPIRLYAGIATGSRPSVAAATV